MRRHTLIGLCGQKGSGKDTVASIIHDMTENSPIKKQRTHSNIVFAEPVKRVAESLVSCLSSTDRSIYRRDNKEAVLPSLGITKRQLWQIVGTDMGRKLISDDIWVSIAKSKIEEMRTLFEKDTLLIVTDVRFENEADMVRDLGGLIIRVDRKTEYSDTHASEVELLNITPNYILDNNGSIKDTTHLIMRDIIPMLDLLEAEHKFFQDKLSPKKDVARSLATNEQGVRIMATPVNGGFYIHKSNTVAFDAVAHEERNAFNMRIRACGEFPTISGVIIDELMSPPPPIVSGAVSSGVPFDWQINDNSEDIRLVPGSVVDTNISISSMSRFVMGHGGSPRAARELFVFSSSRGAAVFNYAEFRTRKNNRTLIDNIGDLVYILSDHIHTPNMFPPRFARLAAVEHYATRFNTPAILARLVTTMLFNRATAYGTLEDTRGLISDYIHDETTPDVSPAFSTIQELASTMCQLGASVEISEDTEPNEVAPNYYIKLRQHWPGQLDMTDKYVLASLVSMTSNLCLLGPDSHPLVAVNPSTTPVAYYGTNIADLSIGSLVNLAADLVREGANTAALEILNTAQERFISI